MNNKMNKNTVPEGISIPMAMMDMVPVLFFGGTGFLLGKLLNNPVTVICAIEIFLSGFLKVLWKVIAGISGKNVWVLFVQMRILMPLGFLALMISCAVSCWNLPEGTVGAAVFGMPQVLFFLAGLIGMAGMIYCAVKMDSSDPKANWIEQSINCVAQGCIFLGFLMMLYLK